MTSNKESVIKDKVMDERGPVPDSTWAQLQIRGSGTQVNDALTRWGWSRDQLVVTPVIITEPSSGKVMGSKWEVRGKVAKYTINATTLWNDASKNVAVHVDLEGESFKFSNRGTGVPANFSDWRDLRQGNLLRFQEGEEEVGWDELMEGGKDTPVDACVRLEIHIANSKEAALYLTWCPLSLEDIKAKCETWEVDVMSDRIPCALLYMGIEPDHKRSSKAKIMVQEPTEAKIGFGVLPLIQQVINSSNRNTLQ